MVRSCPVRDQVHNRSRSAYEYELVKTRIYYTFGAEAGRSPASTEGCGEEPSRSNLRAVGTRRWRTNRARYCTSAAFRCDEIGAPSPGSADHSIPIWFVISPDVRSTSHMTQSQTQ